jgi:hypothetical protein
MRHSGTGFEITFKDRGEYLFAEVTGEKDTLDVSLAHGRRVIDECAARDLRKVLIEEKFPNQLSAIDVYSLMTEVSRMVASRIAIAFVDREAAHEELNLFGETVATNRGATGKVFSTTEAAKRWLMEIE